MTNEKKEDHNFLHQALKLALERQVKKNLPLSIWRYFVKPCVKMEIRILNREEVT